MTILQQWEGVVQSINGDTFWARLHGTIGQPGEHMAQIKFVALDERARWLVEPGRLFVWTIDDGGDSAIQFYRRIEAEAVMESSRYWFDVVVPRRGRRLLALLEGGPPTTE